MRVGDTVWPQHDRGRGARWSRRWRPRCSCWRRRRPGWPRGRRPRWSSRPSPTSRSAAEVKRVETVAKRRQSESPTQYFGVVLALDKTDPPADEAGAAGAGAPVPARAARPWWCRGRRCSTRTGAGSPTGARPRRFAAVPVKLGPSTRRAGDRGVGAGGRRCDRPARPGADPRRPPDLPRRRRRRRGR